MKKIDFKYIILIILYISVFGDLLGQCDSLISYKVSSERYSSKEKVSIRFVNKSSKMYLAHIKILAKQKDTIWTALISEGQQEFFEIIKVEGESSKQELIRVKDLIKQMYSTNTRGESLLRIDVLFTEFGVHPSKSVAIECKPFYFIIDHGNR